MNKKTIIPYITGGDPNIQTTEKLITALDNAGADMILVGVPFSDPIAEGPIVEAATDRALQGGCTVDALFDMLEKIEVDAPIIFMTYYNPVYAYGVVRFTARAKTCGIAGLIVPDLPFEERDELLKPCHDCGLELISVIAPSSEQRIDKIAKNSGEFLYCISSLADTGATANMVKRAKAVSDIPCCAGFDLATVQDAKNVAEFADGIIIGDAIVKIIAEHGENCVDAVAQFVKTIKKEVQS